MTTTTTMTISSNGTPINDYYTAGTYIGLAPNVGAPNTTHLDEQLNTVTKTINDSLVKEQAAKAVLVETLFKNKRGQVNKAHFFVPLHLASMLEVESVYEFKCGDLEFQYPFTIIKIGLKEVPKELNIHTVTDVKFISAPPIPDSKIKNVYFNDAKKTTTVVWKDKEVTVVKCHPDDEYSHEVGLVMCIAKRFYGNRGCFNTIISRLLK